MSTRSRDPSTQVGAVIVNADRNTIVSTGYNDFPRGVQHLPERYTDRDTKYMFVCHAERNALDHTLHSVVGHTIYCTLFPCNECMKSIIQRGIKRIVAPKLDERFVRWAERFQVSMIMASEVGMEIHHV